MEKKKILVTNFTSGINVIIPGVGHFLKRGSEKEEVFNLIKEYNTNPTEDNYTRLINLLYPEKALSTFAFSNDIFVVSGEKLFIKGTDLEVPNNLKKIIMERMETGLDLMPWVNAFTLLALNPNAQVRRDFLDYCNTYGVTITQHGYAVLYKAVTHKFQLAPNEDLEAFVAESYITAKRKKKGRDKFFVYYVTAPGMINGEHYETNSYYLSSSINLDELYPNLTLLDGLANIDPLNYKQKRTVYTDKHSETMNIHLGEVQRQDRSSCDPNININCSKGLHVGSYKYVAEYADPGDTIFACFVNPQHIVAIPKSDTSKIRTCEYFPYAIMRRGNKDYWEELDHGIVEEDYMAYEREQLVKDIQNGTLGRESKTYQVKSYLLGQ